MVVTTTSKLTTKQLVDRLSIDYPEFKFIPGKQEHWSPKLKSITYNSKQDPLKTGFGILHELAHALLDHNSYDSDFELVKLESEAWALAAKLGQKYDVKITDEHIQICLDTYRDWLHRRSTCPSCSTHVLQKDSHNYYCYNCQATWQVSSARFGRPYRKTVK